MTRIVTYADRYKRAPKKRKAVALDVPAVVRKSNRRPSAERAAAEVGEVTSRGSEAAPSIARTAANDYRKSAIATTRRRGSGSADVPDITPEEHRRRGDAADALFRELVRRVREDRDDQ
jgi:hypothetical protein